MSFVSTIGAIAGFPDQIKQSLGDMITPSKITDQELRHEIQREHGVGLAEPPYFVAK